MSSAASPMPFMLSAVSSAWVCASADFEVNAAITSVSATIATPTPVDINKPCMASFSVVALTAAPRNEAVITCTKAFIRTDVAFHTSEAAFIAIVRTLTIACIFARFFKPLTIAETAITVLPICAVMLSTGIMPPIVEAIASPTSANLFLSICKLAAPLLLIMEKASSIVPALPFIASTFSLNLSASCPVRGPNALRLSALPNNLP